MAAIERVKVTRFFDSLGIPTFEAEVKLTEGILTRATVLYVPTLHLNASKQHDKCPESQDLEKINRIIGPELIGKDPTDQTGIDNCLVQLLDGAVNGELKAIRLAVSIAVCQAGARVINIPRYEYIAHLAGNKTLVLPVPAFNVINGGSRAGNKLAIQEFMIVPVGARSFREAVDMGMRIYFHVELIKMTYGQDATNIGYEGGISSSIQGDNEALVLLKTAIDNTGLTGKVVIGIDVAASKFYGTDKTYDLNFKEKNNDGSQKISGVALKSIYKSYAADYPIAFIENPFNEDDWEQYANLTSEIGEGIQIVGENLFATNPKMVEKSINKTKFNCPLLEVKKVLVGYCTGKKVQSVKETTIPEMVEMAIDKKSCNALLLKVNQIGSVTESIEAVKISKHADWGVMASHYGGETEDFIADLSVGLAMGQIKMGAPCWSERLAVYKKFMQIEEELGTEAIYAGANFRRPVEPY